MKTVSTRSLLLCGIAAAVLFPSVVVIQAFAREGFDLAVHPLSLLSLGDAGWIQIANFVVSGSLLTAFAFGVRRVSRSHRGGRWGPLLLGVYGLSNVAAGVFPVDPMLGFPPGAPEDLPETLSWHAALHNVTFVSAFLGLIVAQFVFARRFASLGKKGFATYCLVTGLATPSLIVVSQTTRASTGYVLLATLAVVHVWIIVLGTRMLAEHPSSSTPRETSMAVRS